MEILNPIDYLKLKFMARIFLSVPCIPCALFTVQLETYRSVSKKENENEKKKLQTV